MHRIYFKEIAEFQYYGSPLLFFFTSRDISTECVNKLFQSLGSFNSPNFSELWNFIHNLCHILTLVEQNLT